MAKQFTTEQLKETVKELLKFTKSIAPQLAAIAKDREFELVITNDENGIGMSCSMGWDPTADPEAVDIAEGVNVAEAEEELIRQALIVSNWDKRKAAEACGLSERGLCKKIKKYGISKSQK